MIKKNLLILGGNSKKNISWLAKFKNEFSKDYEVKDIFYEHWSNNNEIDLDLELEKTSNMTLNLKDYYMISKSIGSIISIMGISKKVIKPKKLVILGYPLDLLKRNNLNINLLINDIFKDTEILVIQQVEDPIGKYIDVVNELSNIKVVGIPGNDHLYDNVKIIRPLIDEFLMSKEDGKNE